MSIYRMVHTIGKRKPGGDSGGWFNCSNVSMPPPEISADKPPTINGMAIAIINCLILEFKDFTSVKSI